MNNVIAFPLNRVDYSNSSIGDLSMSPCYPESPYHHDFISDSLNDLIGNPFEVPRKIGLVSGTFNKKEILEILEDALTEEDFIAFLKGCLHVDFYEDCDCELQAMIDGFYELKE